LPATRYRIAFFTKSKNTTLYTSYVIWALRRAGCKVLRVNMAKLRRHLGAKLADRLTRRRVDRFRPDACIIFSGDMQRETLEYYRGRVGTALLLDDYFPVASPVTEKIKMVDVFFHTMTGQLDEYRAAGAKRAVYVHSGVDPQVHRRSKPVARYTSDVAFIGKAFYDERIRLIQSLAGDVDLKVYGKGWQEYGVPAARSVVGVKAFSRICGSAKIMLGIDKAADRELYFSNRTWFVLGCGGVLLTRYVPGLEQMFANHKHLVWFQDVGEVAELIRYYLKHENERQRIGRAGYDFAHEHYPFDRMAENMIRVVFENGEPTPLTDPGPSRTLELSRN
jgi:hypothetical protein